MDSSAGDPGTCQTHAGVAGPVESFLGAGGDAAGRARSCPVSPISVNWDRGLGKVATGGAWCDPTADPSRLCARADSALLIFRNASMKSAGVTL